MNPHYPPPPPGPPYPGYAPPGYPPPGHYPPQGYYGPPGHYPPPGYGGWPSVLKPGVIPLRPLSLSDIFNGAVAYIRSNPKATLGLTTIVVVAAQLVTLLLQIGPLSTLGAFEPTPQGEPPSASAIAVFLGSTTASLLITQLASLLLTGMLTVVIGRSVFGGTITIGEAWHRLRGRFLALVGLTVLEGLVLVVIGALIALAAVVAGNLGGPAAAFLLVAPFGLAAVIGVVYAKTVLVCAPSLIVLERMPVFGAIARSFALVKRDFWRVLGIWLLAAIVTAVLGSAVGAPFSIVGQLLEIGRAHV